MLVNSRDGDTPECWKTKWSLRLNVGYWWWWGPMPEYLRTKRSSHLNVGFWLVDAYYHIQLTFRWVNIQVWGSHYHLQPTFRWGDLLVLNDSSVGTPPLLVNSIKAWVTLRNDGFLYLNIEIWVSITTHWVILRCVQTLRHGQHGGMSTIRCSDIFLVRI